MARKKQTAVEVVSGDAVSHATEARERPKPERVAAATEREAKACTNELKADFQKFTTAWWEMGKRVKDALDRQVPAALEMNAHEWMLSVFGESASVAKIQRSLRIARALNGLPEEKVKLLTEGKAYLLTQLKEKDREEYLDAATMVGVGNEQFAEMVGQKHAEYGMPPEERRAHIGCTVSKSVAEMWEECEKKVARLHDLDIELKPGLRATVFEMIAQLILQTPDEVLTAEMVGGDGVAEPEYQKHSRL